MTAAQLDARHPAGRANARHLSATATARPPETDLDGSLPENVHRLVVGRDDRASVGDGVRLLSMRRYKRSQEIGASCPLDKNRHEVAYGPPIEPLVMSAQHLV
jgi:hypothetical protein